MNILLVYREYPDTFRSFKYALNFISEKASFPPLGFLTAASVLPEELSKKLIDMNTGKLGDGPFYHLRVSFAEGFQPLMDSSSIKELVSFSSFCSIELSIFNF